MAKICLLGDPGVGKTSLIRRFVYDSFDDKYLSTIGTKVSKKDIAYPERYLTLMLWDIFGQKIRNYSSSYYAGAKAALLVADITRSETLMNLERWMEGFRESVEDPFFVLLVNKTDLRDEAELTEEEAGAFAQRMGVPYYLTSAKTGSNVEESFRDIGAGILSRYLNKKENK